MESFIEWNKNWLIIYYFYLKNIKIIDKIKIH